MLRIVIWDVQHGSATYIRTPAGQHIVHDLGTGAYGQGNREFSPLRHLKSAWGISQLDAAIITHPHRDHLDDIFNLGSPRVLARPKHLSEQEIWAGNPKGDAQTAKIIRRYLEVNAGYSVPVGDKENPFLPRNNGGAYFWRFYPHECSTSNLNNHSIVTIVSYAGFKVVLPGDNEQCSWRELSQKEDFRKAISGAHILLAPHHGREAGFWSPLFELFRPYLTIISDGPFGDTSATDRYSAVSQGWTVERRNGERQRRKCVTTRKDGVIVVEIGYNAQQQPYMRVAID